MTFLLIGMIVVVIIIWVKTYTLKREPEGVEKKTPPIDQVRVALKLSKAIQCPTVSYPDMKKVDWTKFEAYHTLMRTLYPLVHEKLELMVINKYSFLYHWKGKKADKKPVLFMAHFDVVPVEKRTVEDWIYPAFSGAIEEGFVWGRGSIDTKITMIGGLEAVELLLEKGFQPEQDIYFAFGHDEEVGGVEGAGHIGSYLEEQGIVFDFILDEGGLVAKEGMTKGGLPTAVVGIAEKGYVDFKISVKGLGGHASMPPKKTALDEIGKVMVQIRKHPMPLRLSQPMKLFFEKMGPTMGLSHRIILANLWLFKNIFLRLFAKTDHGNAFLRTTMALTMAEGSNAPNVLPQVASVVLNSRLAQEDTVEDLEKHIRKITQGIPLTIEVLKKMPSSKIASVASKGYQLIEQSIQSIFSQTWVTPYLVAARTDTGHYSHLCSDIYRFAPIMLDKKERGAIHGMNEKISLENIERCVKFYQELIQQL